jgi:hypothetical protein
MRRILLTLLVIGAVPHVSHADDLEAKAKKLAQSAIIIDGHLDTPMQLEMKWKDVATEAKLLLIGIPLFLWTVIPVYHLVMFAVSPLD